MVVPLARPLRPLTGAHIWRWDPDGRPYVRIWHLGGHGPTAATALRRTGPLARFDHHLPTSDPALRVDPASSAEPSRRHAPVPHAASGSRGIVYLAESLRTAGAEVFGDLPVAEVCPAWQASLLRPSRPCRLANLRGAGAMRIGALPALGSGNEHRVLTQQWARAIYEDLAVDGIRYSGAHDEGACLALFERAPALRVLDGQELRLHEHSLWRRFQVALHTLGLPAARIRRRDCPRCLAD
jgi:hypothetical protein